MCSERSQQCCVSNYFGYKSLKLNTGIKTMTRSISWVVRITLCISITLSGLSASQAAEYSLRYGEIYTLQNQYRNTPTTPIAYLDTRGWGCEDNVFCVSAATSENRDQGSGTWKIVQYYQDWRLEALNKADFAVYGDMPYGAVDKRTKREDLELLKNAIIPYIKESSDLPFVIHVGDIGRPKVRDVNSPEVSDVNSCNDDVRNKTLDQWSSTNKALFYTPGDNDWTDCHSVEDLLPLDELQKVRLMFSDPRMKPDLRNKFSIHSDLLQQANYPENQMWIKKNVLGKNVLYVSIHVVGSHNGWVYGDTSRQNEVRQRNVANFEWLEKALSYAQAGFDAMVIATHVDLLANEEGSTKGRGFIDCLYGDTQYSQYCEKLGSIAYRFANPVLLVHGDTNAHCLDQPIAGRSNFWRLNAPGDYKLIDMDIVTINPSNRNYPFYVRRLLDGSTPPAVCDYTQ